MKKVLTALSLVALSGCGQQSSELKQEQEPIKMLTRAAINAELAAKPDGDNVVWSSASLDGLLAFVGLGYDDARQDLLSIYLGKSVSDAAKSTYSLNVEKEGVKISSVNNMWNRASFALKPGYISDLDTYYGGIKAGSITSPDATAKEVNQWAFDNTNGLIKNVISPDAITPELASLLANALYFKGQWAEEFSKERTRDLPFNAVSKSGVASVETVATMQKSGRNVEFAVVNSADSNRIGVVRLPYKGDSHSMYVAFALKSTDDRLAATTSVDADVDVADVYRSAIVDGAAFSASVGKAGYDLFTLPKFEIESKLNGIHVNLAAGGYGELFSRGVLSRMTSDSRAQLSFILQKAKIIVDEEGTEAAAVTIGGVTTTSVQKSRYLKVDGPFAYAVRDDEKGVTLFEGMVRNPAGK